MSFSGFLSTVVARSSSTRSSTIQAEVREEFLLVVQQHVPKVLADLEASVLPLFINHAKRVQRAHKRRVIADAAAFAKRVPNRIKFRTEAQRIEELFSWDDDLEAAFQTWATRHWLVKDGIAPEWIRMVVEATLHAWWQAGVTPEWCLAGGAMDLKPSKGRGSGAHIMRWAVQVQVEGLATIDVYKNKTTVDADDVQHGVGRVLDLVGLTRRPQKRGRPRIMTPAVPKKGRKSS
jgi:hypothetical protein